MSSRLRRTSLTLSTAFGLMLALAACGGSTTPSSSTSAPTSAAPTTSAPVPAPSPTEPTTPAAGPITIGAFGFGESKILAHLYAVALTSVGYEPTVVELTNREVVEPALEAGEVQVVPEYLGTFTEFLNLKINGPDATPLASGDVEATLAALKPLAESVGITVLTPSPAVDQNAFAVTKEFADANGLVTISDLAEYSKNNPVVLGGPPECPERPFCQPGLEKTYGLNVGEFVALDAGGPLTKAALQQGEIEVGLIFSSDGAIDANKLVVLVDDKALQTADNVIAAVNTAAYSPALQEALDALAAALTTADLIALNKSVDIDRVDPEVAAREWLAAKGLFQ
ncbi:MAG: ABC transporter substrate-binding protein [Candidatus Nanopelagicales bacterium]